jgi:hypothetical protein
MVCNTFYAFRYCHVGIYKPPTIVVTSPPHMWSFSGSTCHFMRPSPTFYYLQHCRNPSLGLTTKARVCKSASQERSPRVWVSVKMNSHIPKLTPIFRSWSPDGLLKLQRVIKKGKTPRLDKFFISLESY